MKTNQAWRHKQRVRTQLAETVTLSARDFIQLLDTTDRFAVICDLMQATGDDTNQYVIQARELLDNDLEDGQ